jgi:hypothetical protein
MPGDILYQGTLLLSRPEVFVCMRDACKNYTDLE